MDPFATVPDLQNRWRPLVESETVRAATLLAAASRKIRRLYPTVDDRIGSGDLDLDSVKDVVCDMVARAMIDPDDIGATDTTDTRGPFSNRRKYDHPRGTLYLTADEEDLFDPDGGNGGAFQIDTMPPRTWSYWGYCP